MGSMTRAQPLGPLQPGRPPSVIPVTLIHGSFTVTIDAWSSLPVQGLVQRYLSNSGLQIDPATVEVHAGKFVLPHLASLDAALSRYQDAATKATEKAQTLKLVTPRTGSGWPRVKGRGRSPLDARGPPLHTVPRVAARIRNALAGLTTPTTPSATATTGVPVTCIGARAPASLPLPGPPSGAAASVRPSAELAAAAAEFCLLPCTFTTWADAWECSLMQLALRLSSALAPAKPAAAAAVLAAAAQLLEAVPDALGPSGPAYAALCAMEMHLELLQLIHNEAQQVEAGGQQMAGASGGRVERQVAARAAGGGSRGAAAAPVAVRGCGGPLAMCVGLGVTTVGSSSSSSSSSTSSNGGSPEPPSPCGRYGSASGGAGGGGVGVKKRGGAAGREAAVAAVAAAWRLLLEAAEARVAAALQQLSSFDSELSGMLEALRGRQGPETAAGRGAADATLRAVQLLEPYAAVQLLYPFARGDGAALQGLPAVLPPASVLPQSCCMEHPMHRSLHHLVLQLASQIHSRRGTQAEPARTAAAAAGGAGPGGGSDSGGSGSGVELRVLARALEGLLGVHLAAHAGCKGAPGKGAQERQQEGQQGAGDAGAGGGAGVAAVAAAAAAGVSSAARGGAPEAAGAGGGAGPAGSLRIDVGRSHDEDNTSEESGSSSSSESGSGSGSESEGSDGTDSEDGGRWLRSRGRKRKACRHRPSPLHGGTLPSCLAWVTDVASVVESCSDVFVLSGEEDGEEQEEQVGRGAGGELAVPMGGTNGGGREAVAAAGAEAVESPRGEGSAPAEPVQVPSTPGGVGGGNVGGGGGGGGGGGISSSMGSSVASTPGSEAAVHMARGRGRGRRSSSGGGSSRSSSRSGRYSSSEGDSEGSVASSLSLSYLATPPHVGGGVGVGGVGGDAVGLRLARAAATGGDRAGDSLAANGGEGERSVGAEQEVVEQAPRVAATAGGAGGAGAEVPEDEAPVLAAAATNPSSSGAASMPSPAITSPSSPDPPPAAPRPPSACTAAASAAASAATAALYQMSSDLASSLSPSASTTTTHNPHAPIATGSHRPGVRSVIVGALLRALQSPCLASALCSGPRGSDLVELPLWLHPRLATCAPAAAYQQQLLDELLPPLSYVYEDDCYDAPVLCVCRSDLLGSSVSELMQYDSYALESEGLSVRFEGEQAFGDGVLREWLTEVSSLLFDPNAGLFRLCEGDVRALHPCAAGAHQDNHLELMEFAGRILGLALRAGVPLGLHLSTALYKLLQSPGKGGPARLGAADLTQLEPRVAAACAQIAATEDVEALALTFVASCGHLGAAHEVPLLPYGNGTDAYDDPYDVPVTAANRHDYLARLARFYCTWGCSSMHASVARRAQGAVAGAAGGAGEEGGEQQHGQKSRSGGRSTPTSWEDCELDVVTALAQGLADTLVFREGEEGVALLGARLRAIGAAAFNGRLGGQAGDVCVATWRQHASAPGFKGQRGKAILDAFWTVVGELSAEERRRLLQFWTGLAHLPAGGFKSLGQQLQLVPARSMDQEQEEQQQQQQQQQAQQPTQTRTQEDQESNAVDAAPLLAHEPTHATAPTGSAPQPPQPSPTPAPAATPAPQPLLLSAHTCFFQLRLPLTGDVGAMRGAVAESLANLGSFWNEWEEE